jgi:hypothetical protein
MIAFDGIPVIASAMKRAQPDKKKTTNADFNTGENRGKSLALCQSTTAYKANATP